MAKKSNKTEHVLKLITKDEELLESLNEKEPSETIEQEVAEPEDQDGMAEPCQEQLPEVEISVKPKKEQQLKYEAKLKIEIDPEVGIKPKDEVPQSETAEPQQEALQDEKPRDSAECPYSGRRVNLVNIAEVIVNEKISLVMERMKVCTCPTCVNDVLALALNSLPTKYVTTDAGKQYFQLDIYKKQYETDVLAALTKACVRVKASPRHS